MEKKIVVKAIIVLILLVFIANILMAFIIVPAHQNPPPGYPPLPQPTFLEILLISITNPLVLILALGGGLWLILSALGERETAIPDRYRIYLTFILTLWTLLSIQLWVNQLGHLRICPPSPPCYEYDSIIPPIIMVSIVTIFVAITTYMRRYYPYAAIFASLLLGVIYLPALPLTALPYIGYYIQRIYFFSIPLVPVFASACGAVKKWAWYIQSYSLVSGIVVAGMMFPTTSGWEGIAVLFQLFIYLLLTFLSGILTVILFQTKSRYELANKYFITSLKVTLSMIVFTITILVTFFIFQPYYIFPGLND